MYIKLAFFLLASCSIRNTDKIRPGKFNVAECNPIMRMISTYPGSYFQLNNDGTYIEETCAQIIKGTWIQKNDTIYATITSYRYQIDSLNHSPKYIEDIKSSIGVISYYKVESKDRFSETFKDRTKLCFIRE